MKIEVEAIHMPACGLDVHKDVIEACVFGEDGNGEIKTFSTMRNALFALRDWIVSRRCFHVLMESTSVFWIPIFEILESVAGMDVGVGNARHMKNIPGRAKTDKSDAAWIAKLCVMGLIRKSFVAPRKFRELREYTRYHKKLTQEKARHINRIEKLLQMNGFKLSSVLSDITGVSALRLLKKLRDNGKVTAAEVAAVLAGRCKHTPEEIENAINGEMKLTSRLLLGKMLEKLETCDKEIAEIYGEMVRLSKPFEAQVKIVDSVPAIAELSAMYIIAEIGDDMSPFPSAKHFAAWAGLAPKDVESAGKLKSSKTRKANIYIKSILAECAWSAIRMRGTRVSNWYWRNAKRLGEKKAITAVARKLLCYVYALLKSGELYDKSLDAVDTDKIEAQKLESARKILGSQTKSPRSKKQPPDATQSSSDETPPRKPSAKLSDAEGIGIPPDPPQSATKKRGRPRKIKPQETTEF